MCAIDDTNLASLLTATILIRGFGSIGRRHAQVFHNLGAEVIAWPVRTRDPTPTDGVRLVNDAEALELAGHADLVVIATDTARHVTDAVTVLEVGAARVLLEKPAAPAVREVERLVDHPGAVRVFVAAPLR